jgi:molybdate transport system substrate-binding protein
MRIWQSDEYLRPNGCSGYDHMGDSTMTVIGSVMRAVPRPRLWAFGLLAVGIAVCVPFAAKAEQIYVAVAANFTDAAKEIAQLFETKTGHKVILSFGSTGQFYTQITQGAPFQVFLSADQATPKRTIDDDLAVADTLFTYAVGKIVLYSNKPETVKGENTLREANFQKIAIANPTTAPYGAAAVEAMKALGVYDALRHKLVQGNNIAQTFQFVDTGSVELGFIALSQIPETRRGSRWIVPDALYSPINQDAILLKKGASSDAAREFITFLKRPEAATIIEKYGYATRP